jgi:hypothetical protein
MPHSSVQIEEAEKGLNQDSHAHDEKAKETKVPKWILKLIEPIFKINKRGSTVEVKLVVKY